VKDKSPALQWYPKQYLGDDKVIAMDWDARGMHHWLLNISWQQEPKGSIPDDMALIRRWLGSPTEDIWRRVRPQIFSAWTLRDGRWFNDGMVRTAERQKVFSESRTKSLRKRYEKPTKAQKTEEEVITSTSKEEKQKDDDLNSCDYARGFCDRHAISGQTAFDGVKTAIEYIAREEGVSLLAAHNALSERLEKFRGDPNQYKGSEKNWFSYGKYRREKPKQERTGFEEWDEEYQRLEREYRERRASERSN
jgi:hypothetical protein